MTSFMTQLLLSTRRATPARGGARLPADRPFQRAGAVGERVEQRAHLGQAGAQLRVADLDGHERVLQLGDLLVGALDAVDRAVEDALRAVRRTGRRDRRERALRQAVAGGEARMRALRARVGDLRRAEDLLLQA